MAKRKSKAVVMVADGVGGLAKVEDRRFEPADWATSFDVTKEQAATWFLYFDAECNGRGWSRSEMGQHDLRESSGSITISTGAEAPQLTVIWERKRGGALKVRARSSGTIEMPPADMQTLFEGITAQCRLGAKERYHSRGQLYYDGLPWRGELWLDDTLCLSPPSQQYQGATRGPRVILVDAVVDAVGRLDSLAVASQGLDELAVFLGVVTGEAIRRPRQTKQGWTWTTVEGATACDVRWIGYTEPQIANQMPVAGTFQAAPEYPVVRPDFTLSVNHFIGASELSVPADIRDLWARYRLLATDRRRQFLQAAAKWQEGIAHWPERPTLSFALMVVACEALKPSDRKFEHHNINHVIEALLGAALAARLKTNWFRAQYVRSVHMHLGQFLGSEFLPGTTQSRFYDPTFDAARRDLEAITRAAIIEWLRRSGTFSLPALKRKRKRTVEVTRAPKAGRPRSKRYSNQNRAVASYASIFQKNFRPTSSKLPKSCSPCGSLSSVKRSKRETSTSAFALTMSGSSATLAVITTLPAENDLRNASLSSRTFSVLMGSSLLPATDNSGDGAQGRGC